MDLLSFQIVGTRGDVQPFIGIGLKLKVDSIKKAFALLDEYILYWIPEESHEIYLGLCCECLHNLLS